MRHFIKQFKHKAYIVPGVLLLTWLILIILRLNHVVLWVQGEIYISIVSIVFFVFLVSLAISKFIERKMKPKEKMWIGVPIGIFFIAILYSILVLLQPITWEYKKNGEDVILIQHIESKDKKRTINFYTKSNIFAKRVDYCTYIEGENIYDLTDERCEYVIMSGTLTIEKRINGTISRTVIDLD